MQSRSNPAQTAERQTGRTVTDEESAVAGVKEVMLDVANDLEGGN